MLKKLIKVEFYAVSRIMLPLYLALCGVTAFSFFIYMLPLNEGILKFIPILVTTVFTITLIGLMVASIISVLIRFYKNLVTNEGYLMFTLPVKVSDLIFSKLIVAFSYIMTTILLCIGSFAILSKATNSPFSFDGLYEEWKLLLSMANVSEFTLILIVIFFIIFALCCNLLMFYASIALGQKITKNKVLGAVIGYIIIYMIYQAVNLTVILLVFLLKIEPNFLLAVIALLLYMLVIDGILFGIIKNHLTNKLNLE